MSFILDALRKSENERRLEAAPDIMRAAPAVPRERVPLWAILAIGGLAAALLAVTLYNVIDRGSESVPTSVAAPREQQAPVASEPTPAAAAASTPQVITELPQEPVPPPPAPAVAAQATPQLRVDVAEQPPDVRREPAEPAPTATPPRGQGAPGTGARSGDVSGLPTYAAVLGEGIGVGALQMQLHVHSSVPASRFVVINGSRYLEGDRISENLIVEDIVVEGAILSYRGRRFLLTPN